MKPTIIKEYILQEALLNTQDKVLVALSGGADSVALLRVLLDLGYPCEAAHCNFHLRDEESNRDEAFVRQLCHELKVTLHVTHFDTQQEADRRRISIEMAARELRYQWFEEVRISCGAAAIAVAHHRDDSVETFLLNLMRGTGINGLRGIRPKNGHIIRPLLSVWRRDIVAYLNRIGQPYVTDSTNLQDEYMRNKIRLNLLPLMESIHPSVQESILQTAHHLTEASLIYSQGVQEALQRIRQKEGICIERLLKEPAPQTLLHEALSPLGFNSSQIGDIFRSLNSQSGKLFLSDSHQVVRDRKLLLIEPRNTPQKPHLACSMLTCTPDFKIPKNSHIACLDAHKVTLPLTLRLYRPGDSFIPFGMKGRKKVSDYLTDRKRSLLQKQKQWVLCSGEEIAWLVGERIDQRFCIGPDTRQILKVEILQHEDSSADEFIAP